MEHTKRFLSLKSTPPSTRWEYKQMEEGIMRSSALQGMLMRITDFFTAQFGQPQMSLQDHSNTLASCARDAHDANWTEHRKALFWCLVSASSCLKREEAIPQTTLPPSAIDAMQTASFAHSVRGPRNSDRCMCI